ncbi:holo-ACP synthase [Desulfurispira natronophila]|uniref:Holo-[acyl-carrier-protein] synthase n=1 Tax=Desulfurispira natronophila TaxID=682562 RepID=A0A7W7Y5Q5_9BACT|nr:holo-ACP synthase [Desulfurispira natronophila]MBB5022302.1 holo-[acyl-carrier protein] synthase [Desulfurispira natronophila]
MIVGIGVDMVAVERFDGMKVHFLERVFTAGEIQYASASVNSQERFAARFAAKEAFLKAIGTGLRNCRLKDIEVVHDELGCPHLGFYGNLESYGDKSQYRVHLSLSHTSQHAIAYCLVESTGAAVGQESTD